MLDLGISDPKDIDLEAIAWSRGAIVHYRPLDKCEATIVGTKTRAVITINSMSIPRRRRYSLGHEIGHWHYHKGRILYCGPSDVENPSINSSLNPERQANDFASDLLLPNYLFRPRALKLGKPTLNLIRELAEEFQVSATATLLKLVQCDVYPLVIVCHNKQQRRWFRRSVMLDQWWFPREELDPDSFAFDMLFKGLNESPHPRKIGAGAWFEFRNVDRYEILEQSFLLPNDEILSVLTLPQVAVD